MYLIRTSFLTRVEASFLFFLIMLGVRLFYKYISNRNWQKYIAFFQVNMTNTLSVPECRTRESIFTIYMCTCIYLPQQLTNLMHKIFVLQ